MGHQRVAFGMPWILSSVLTVGLTATPSDPPARVQMAQGPEQRWALTAVEGAARRLSDPRCQQVLSDFTDPTGLTLFEGLALRRLSPLDHVRDVWFLKGDTQPLCNKRTTSAFTVAGGRLVFMCPRLFRRQVSKYDELLLIHEILHTLGLGENPPSSDAITKQVAVRCGEL